MSAEINTATGKLPVSERLHDSSVSVIAANEPAADSVFALLKTLQKLQSNLDGIWNASGCVAHGEAQRDKTSLGMLEQDAETAGVVLKQMTETVERINGVRAAMVAKKS
jgi:hypothetical protein